MSAMGISERFLVKSTRNVLVGSAVLTAVVFVVPHAHAQQPPAQPSPPEARVIVVGEGSVRLVPDYAQLRGGVITRAKTVQEANDANAKLMVAVMAALHDAGIADTDIQTSQFSIQPVYASPPIPNDIKVTGYSVSNQVTVKVRPLDKVPGILDRMVAAGASDVTSVSFLHSDTAKALDQAREAALADARRKAELYAHVGGFTLGRVAGITEESGIGPMQMLLRLPAPSASAAPAVPISAGEDTLRVRITVGYDIAGW